MELDTKRFVSQNIPLIQLSTKMQNELQFR